MNLELKWPTIELEDYSNRIFDEKTSQLQCLLHKTRIRYCICIPYYYLYLYICFIIWNPSFFWINLCNWNICLWKKYLIFCTEVYVFKRKERVELHFSPVKSNNCKNIRNSKFLNLFSNTSVLHAME